MAFFKGFRDQLKANALMSHLEFTRDRFPRDHVLGMNHLAAAVKAVVTIKHSESQKSLTFVGWKFIVQLTSEVAAILLVHGYEDAAKDCEYILQHAIKWRDEADE